MTDRFPDHLARLDLDAALSPVEGEVAQLVACGLTDTAMASALTRSTHTMHTHVIRMLRKTGARNRSDLVIWMYETEHLVPGRSHLSEMSPRYTPVRGGAITDRRVGLNLHAELPHDLVDIARLVACGLTNDAIATRLHRNVDAVNYGVRRLRTITGAKTRVQITVWMYETGRVRPGAPDDPAHLLTKPVSPHQPVTGPTTRPDEEHAHPEMPSAVQIRACVMLSRPERADWLLIREHGAPTWRLPGRDVITTLHTPTETVLSMINDVLGFAPRCTPRFCAHTWNRTEAGPRLTYLFALDTLPADLRPQHGIDINWVHRAVVPRLLSGNDVPVVHRHLALPAPTVPASPYLELIP
ncbi:LuxR C-terminal-related transcriptional regulator [Saccharopolyspora gregorii]|uniref:LuxR C-terminal-related transcriptional regulator n=1 Tax=Saccharopolyspora gregorii TaxID=33914 RepID=UPI0021ACC0BA|nr:LuxR C-terminal-related transcriptional regulator [Saccharopolyspora gregorii]